MGKATGFMDYKRDDIADRPPAERVRDFEPIHLPLSEKRRRQQGGRCMDCGVPFCQAGIVFDGKRLGCPLHNLVPEWNDFLWSGNYPAALSRLLKTAPFPEFTGRVCPGLCETACTCGMIGESVTVRDNECAIIEYAFENDLMQPCIPAVRSDRTIAVVGSGPAGLSAAYYLNRRGHNVTVFERDSVPGGLLTYGIAPVKLPQSVVSRRIRLMEQEGVGFVTGCDIRPDNAVELLGGFDYVIFACGAQKPRVLRFETSVDSGVYYALEYLKEANTALTEQRASALSAKGKRVIVVGAGDSAGDCVSMALRQGCTELTQLVRRGAENYTGPLDYAHQESEAVFGGEIRRFGTEIKDLRRDENGALCGVVLNTGEELGADMAVIASGFSGCEDYVSGLQAVLEEQGVPCSSAGDMVSGATLVVLAIASGKEAAAACDRALMGYTNIL